MTDKDNNNRKKKWSRLPEGDDGRTIVNMNVEGMPWYRRGQNGSEESGSASSMTDEEVRMYRFAAVKAGLLIALVFGAVFFLFIAFCDFVWFGN